MFHYIACGLTIASELELPCDVLPESGRHRADVTVRFGKVPNALADETGSGAAFSVSKNELLFTAPNVGRFLAIAGKQIIIDRMPGATDTAVRVFLLGSSFGSLLHMRGLFPLHASAVALGSEGCVAFSGTSGAGKSTLAAFLTKRGYPLISDDICAIRVDPKQGPVVYPGFRRLKLWGDAMDVIGLSRSDAERLRDADKYELAGMESVGPDPLPLKAVYQLQVISDEAHQPKGVVPMNKVDALRALVHHTYRFRYLNWLGTKKTHMHTSAGIIKSVPIFDWWRDKCFPKMEENLDQLEDHWNTLNI